MSETCDDCGGTNGVHYEDCHQYGAASRIRVLDHDAVEKAASRLRHADLVEIAVQKHKALPARSDYDRIPLDVRQVYRVTARMIIETYIEAGGRWYTGEEK